MILPGVSAAEMTQKRKDDVYKWCQTVGLERYWHWVIGYWAIFADIG